MAAEIVCWEAFITGAASARETARIIDRNCARKMADTVPSGAGGADATPDREAAGTNAANIAAAHAA